MSTPEVARAPVSAAPAASAGEQAPAASFKGKEVRVVSSDQEPVRAGNPDAVDRWKADARLVTEERSSLNFGQPLVFDDPAGLPEPAAGAKAESVLSAAAADADADAKPEAKPVTSLVIDNSVKQARRGGFLGTMMSLVNLIRNLFLPPPAAAADAAAGRGGQNSSLWKEAVVDCKDALGALAEIREQVASPTAQLSGQAPELQEALKERGNRHPLKQLIDPAQTMEALKHKRYALDALAAHPDLPAGTREKLAGRIQAGAAAISELMETRYSPVTAELRPLAKSSLRAFGIPGGGNPYVEMSKNGNLFSPVQDANVRSWLTRALDLLDAAGRLTTDSALGKNTDVDVGELQRQLKAFKKESAEQKAFAHADLLAATEEQDS